MKDTSSVERLVSAVLDAAQRAMQRGQVDDARDLARQVLDVVPDDPVATALLADTVAGGGGSAADHGRRYLTVLFSDVVGSTAFSEVLDPEDYLALMAAYREVVRDAVARHDGYIDQFQGDGVVAYFGFPVAGEDDQLRAVEAGLDIVRGVPEGSAHVGIDVAARVGIHVGRTVMTSSPLGARDQSTAIGFAANVAARVQALARPGTVAVSDSAVDAIAPFFELAVVGDGRLRGVSEDVQVFEVREARARSTMGDDHLLAPLVGRSEERRRIEQAWAAANGRGTDPRLVVLVGEPGLGKSRLVRHAMELARDAGGNVVEINCARGLRHVGLGAIRRAVEKALELGPNPLPDAVREAVRARGETVGLSEPTLHLLESLLVDVDTGAATPELTPDRRREAIINGLLEWIGREAALSPVALVVEDLHWADDTAIETLCRLTARPLPPGLLVVLTARSDGMPYTLRHLLHDALELGPLDGQDTRSLVRAFSGDVELDEAAVDVLAERGDGVPLFTEHLVMAAVAPSPPVISRDALPATLESLLQVRIDSSGPGRGVAELAAVVGREFTVELVERALVELGSAAPVPPARLSAALRALQRVGLVESESDGTMRFRHSLVRDAAYALQLRAERPRRHRAVAGALTALHGSTASPEALAYHLERAGDLEPAAAAYLRAAHRAAELAEFDTALEHLRSAGTLIDGLDGSAGHRLELARCMQIGAVSAASFSYARDEAEQAYRRALELCDLVSAEEGADAGIDVQLMAALGGLWSKEIVAGDLPAARAVTDRLERLLIDAPPELEPEVRRFVLGCRGVELLYAGDTDEAVRVLGEASVLGAGPVPVRLGTPHDDVATLDAVLAVALTLAGDDAAADRALERAVQRTAALPFPIGPFSEAVVEVYAAYVHRLRGDPAAARAAATAVSEIGDRHGFQEHAVLGQILSLSASALEGDAAACQALEATLGIWRMAGGGLAVPVLLAELAEGFVRVGDLDRAGVALDDATAMMERTDQRGCEPEVARLRAVIVGRQVGPADHVLDAFVAAAELALERGSVRLAARSIRDAVSVNDGTLPAVAAVTASRVCAQVPATATGELLDLRRLVSASRG